MNKEILSICIALLLIVIVISGCTEEKKISKTIYVDDGGGKDFTSIQSAINAAKFGDTVYVYDGIYYENIVVNKTITLIGKDNSNTVINGSGGSYVLYISADNVNIADFTIQNNGIYDSGIEIHSNFSSITNNIVTNNYNEGISFDDSHNNVISGNTISNNQKGMLFVYSTNNTISNNNIINNNEYSIYFSHSSGNTISDNTIINNSGNGVDLFSSDNNIISDNTINNSYSGIVTYYSNSNTISDNNIINNKRLGIFLFSSNSNVVYNNDIRNDSNGMLIGYESDYNIIYYNSLMDNSQNANSTGNNIWYNTTLNEGNYWDDYNGTDANGDGIGDTPYNITGGNNQDLYPLMSPVDI